MDGLFRYLGSRGTECLLCPHGCLLKEGSHGLCRVRKAEGRTIHSSSHPVTVMALDPVEKKPFYHFLPGSSTLSIGFSGCNMRCPFCQNHELVESTMTRREWTPGSIVDTAISMQSSSVCFTYSEPTMHIEFLIETARGLRNAGIPALLVTNGCLNPGPGKALLRELTAVKVDLKSFDENYYRQELGGDLKSVRNFIETAYGICHLEVVTLVIPGMNDSLEEIEASSSFLASLSADIPFHLTAYYPRHHYTIQPTSTVTLRKLRARAWESLSFVYTGNTGDLENTHCPGCGTLLIDRMGDGKCTMVNNSCPCCGRRIYGIFRKD